jgi:hypothetical protein
MGDVNGGAPRAPFSDLIAPLIGRRSWGVRQGEGTILTVEFGRPQASQGALAQCGAWRLRIYRTAWRIEDERSVLAACGDPRELIAPVLVRLEGRPLIAVETGRPSFDAVFQFEGLAVRTFDVWSAPVDHANESWELFTPAQRVLVVGPGRRWSYRPEPIAEAP